MMVDLLSFGGWNTAPALLVTLQSLEVNNGDFLKGTRFSWLMWAPPCHSFKEFEQEALFQPLTAWV